MVSRSSSTSSNERSTSSADRTSTTSHTSPDLGYKGKGREVSSLDLDEDEAYGLRSYSWDRRTSWSGRLQIPSLPSTPAFISKRIIHPYPLSGRRRRSSQFASRLGGRRRLIQLILALSIPLFGLLLANELRIGSDRLKLYANVTPASRTHDWEALDMHTPPCEIIDLRRGYEKKRRRELKDAEAQAGSFLTGLRRGWENWMNPTLEEQYENEVEDWWPEWWGGSDEVGKSPYDYTPAPAVGEKKRVLFLTSYKDYLERMNTHTYEIVDAALRHPNIITDVWGPGWKGWDNGLTISGNSARRARRIEQLERSKAEYEEQIRLRALARQREVEKNQAWAKWTLGMSRMVLPEETEYPPWQEPQWLDDYEEGCGPVKWEIVWTISDIFKRWDTHLDVLGCGALLVQQLGDCHEFRCFEEWYPQANNITLSKYAFELEEIFSYDRVKTAYPDWEMGIFGHSPDTANEWDFYPVKWGDKKRDATMFGFDGSFYPIRTTVTDRHNDHNWDHSIPEPLVKHHQHPGYTVGTDPSLFENRLETYTPGHWSYDTHRRLREDFAKGMREARICVFDSSLERKMIRKYAQALLSGCVVAGDIPTEHEAQLSSFMIKLQPSWSIERIESEIQKYLDDTERLQQMALEGFIYARRYLTATRKIDNVLGMATSYRQGNRGYEYPFSFSMKCRAYWRSDNAYRPPWCDQATFRGLEA